MREVISAFLIFPSQLNYHHAIAQNRHQTKNSPEPARRAREQHSNQTPAEQALLEKLRGNHLNGWHFRRQQIIGGYIVDFYCPRAGLAVELDGGIHASQREYDADRDRTLAEFTSIR